MGRNAYCFLMLLSICMFAPCAAPAQQAGLPRESDTAKKCAICHYRWVYTFFIEHKSTPIAGLEESMDSVGETKMCLSCHDGSVRDSRNTVCNTPSHTSGVIPSDRVTIPSNFNLSAKGALLCSTCHTPHAALAPRDSINMTFMREPNINSSLCIRCHSKNMGGTAQGNHPVNVTIQQQPETIIKAGGRFGTEKPNQIICETCHMAHGGAGDKRLVLLARDTAAPAILCEACHTKKPIKPGEPDTRRFSHPVDIRPDSAVEIPETWSSGEKVVLSVQGDLICFTCHRTHDAADKEFLLNEQAGEEGLCVRCHKKQRQVLKSTHDLSLSQHPQKNPIDAPSSRSGPCGSCHAVHTGKGPFMWARQLPSSVACFEGYCKSCHAPGQCAEKAVPGNSSHPAAKAAAVNSARLPLFNDSCEQSTDGKVACMTCHNVHDPSPVTAVTEAGKKGQYLRLGEAGQAALCQSCHADQSLIRGTPHDMSIASPGYRNALGKTPAQSGLCGTCHLVHGAILHEYMWAAPVGGAVPKEWLKAEKPSKNIMVSLCTGCHEKGGIASKHVPRFGLHPGAFYSRVSEIANKRLQLNICLFTPSGAVSPVGGIVCSTCHNTHQWDGKKKERGAGLFEGTIQTSFLRPDLPRVFCSNCHGTEALFKYLYFHNRPARVEKAKDFPFGDFQ
jgi:predicted CXXCH cytochrome family protein